jgi:integrase
MDLGTVRERDKLKPQREPYWQKLAKGQYLGFRPSTIGKGGTWIARFYDPDTRKKDLHALGDFGHLPPSERFTAASAEAREWFTHRAGGGIPEVLTVKAACENYAADKPDAAKRFPRYVYDDPIAKISLHKLTDRHVRDWRKRLEAMPALVTRSKGGTPVSRQRTPATLNRDMVPFRAALNLAYERGEILTNRAWRGALKPVETKSRRHLYLDRDQRRALLAALPDDVATFCRGLCLLPLRPGAIAALHVRDFDPRTGELVIRTDKAGGGRSLILPAETAKLFKSLAKDKLPGAYLFTTASGMPWNKDTWKKPIKEGVVTAALPASTSAYTLRHSTITDLVTDGLDLLTVAQVSGTSVKMIEQHYGHLQREHAKQALAKLTL